MQRKVLYRLLVILAVLAASVYFFVPLDKKIRLGLDLKGGMHLVLQVVTSEALEAEVSQTVDRLNSDFQEKGIPGSAVKSDLEIVLSAIPQDKDAEIRALLDSDYAAQFEIQPSFQAEGVQYRLRLIPQVRTQLEQGTVQQALETIRGRVDALGVAEPTLQLYGGGDVIDQIIVELPGVDDPARTLDIIRTTAKLELRLLYGDEGSGDGKAGPYPSRADALTAFNNSIPSDHEILPYREKGSDSVGYLVARRGPSITGADLKNARPGQDMNGLPLVNFFLNSAGREKFSRATGANVGKRLAIVLDGEVKSTPVIQQRIDDESAQITGQFTLQQAEDLALVLRSGALPASIRILEQRQVGPSLGLDSIRQGILASIVGLALVVVAILVIYKFSGINAFVTLIVNLMLLLAVLGATRATLTLPGIAGVILTIGMAVDSNVLIFERIKEELRLGKSVKGAVDAGFDRVFATIIDTHVTVLISSFFLFQFGTGPVRGFAVTLAVGLISNVFAAVYVSRTMFAILLDVRGNQKISI